MTGEETTGPRGQSAPLRGGAMAKAEDDGTAVIIVAAGHGHASWNGGKMRRVNRIKTRPKFRSKLINAEKK